MIVRKNQTWEVLPFLTEAEWYDRRWDRYDFESGPKSEGDERTKDDSGGVHDAANSGSLHHWLVHIM